ncbi:MAG TPA: hypothetical protein VD866_30260 [Urbifossiella sp.]|nr:hypothetical protein [Urbifossiella sp.]
MAQLVGQHCVHCRERFSSEFGARFCARCGCPVHDDCRRTSGAAEIDCPARGAPPAEMARWRPVADADAQRTAAIAGRQTGTAVWFVTDGWLRRLLRLTWYEDQGWLNQSGGGLVFTGSRRVLRMTPSAVELVGPFLPRLAVVTMVLSNILVLTMVVGGAFTTLTADHPSTYVMLLLVNALMVASHPLRWVRVRYKDEDGKDAEALFAVGSLLIRVLGGTGRLFERLTASKT